MKINGIESGAILSAVVGDLYRKAASPDFNFPLQIRIVDSAEVAKAIFMAPDIFVKNYAFMENLSRGRISANGADWKLRVSITQSFYSRATNVLDEAELEAIYSKHLQAYQLSTQPNLCESFINAALEVVSRAFGLPNTIPWPMDLVNRTRSALIDQQAMAWVGSTPQLAEQSQRELKLIFVEFEALWQSDPAMQQLLKLFSAQAHGIKDFSVVGELLQNVFASTETSASSLLWAIECMTRHANLPAITSPELHPDDMGFFLDEVFRLMPALPFVTRMCTKASEINGMQFAENESIIISIVGVHCNSQHWAEPLLFKSKRQEFVDASYARHAYIPFISGSRVCAGMKLAKQEVKCGVRALLKAFSVERCAEPRRLVYGISSRPGIKLEPYLKPRLNRVM